MLSYAHATWLSWAAPRAGLAGAGHVIGHTSDSLQCLHLSQCSSLGAYSCCSGHCCTYRPACPGCAHTRCSHHGCITVHLVALGLSLLLLSSLCSCLFAVVFVVVVMVLTTITVTVIVVVHSLLLLLLHWRGGTYCHGLQHGCLLLLVPSWWGYVLLLPSSM